MSNVPRAKAIIDHVLKGRLNQYARNQLMAARALLDREKPAFKAAPEVPALTPAQKQEAWNLRLEGWSLIRIMRHLNTNIGRVSEAIKEFRERED